MENAVSEQTKVTEKSRLAKKSDMFLAALNTDYRQTPEPEEDEEVVIDASMVWDPNHILTSCMPYERTLHYYDEELEKYVKKDVSDPNKFMPKKGDRKALGANEFCDISKHM